MDLSSSQESVEQVRRAMEHFELQGEIDASHSNILPLPSSVAPSQVPAPYSNVPSKAKKSTTVNNLRIPAAISDKYADMESIILTDEVQDTVVKLESLDFSAVEGSEDWELIDENGDWPRRSEDEWILIPKELENEITKIKKQIPSAIMVDPSFKAFFKVFADKCKVEEKIENVKLAAGILAFVAKAGAEAASEPVIEWADEVMRRNMDMSISEFSSAIYCQFVSLLPERTRKFLLTNPLETLGRGGFVELGVDIAEQEPLIDL